VSLLRRLVPAVLSATALLPATAVAAVEPTAPVEVTAVLAGADGRLSFVTERAASPARGRDLARQMRGRARVLAAAVATPVRALDVDPLRAQQWGLTQLEAERTWAQGHSTGQLVAVLDTGVEATHPDLQPAVVRGIDLVGSGDGGVDPNGHGTHVAGVIAATADNGVGGAGLARGAKVLPVRVLDADGSGTDGTVAEGVAWAADHGATVVNLSLGGDSPSPVLTAAIRYALSKGVVVVAAAGNAGLDGDPVLYPAATPGVIAVAAVDRNGVRPGWSSSGAHVALAAPGVAILSTVPGAGHALSSGRAWPPPSSPQRRRCCGGPSRR
jgi:subtilisin family serine protease